MGIAHRLTMVALLGALGAGNLVAMPRSPSNEAASMLMPAPSARLVGERGSLRGGMAWQGFVERIADPYAPGPESEAVPDVDSKADINVPASTSRAPGGGGGAAPRARGIAMAWQDALHSIAARIPEPGRGSMLLSGLLGAWFIARRRLRNANQAGRF